jgi:pyruvate,water dikinase
VAAGTTALVVPLESLSRGDLAQAGGKATSLGEMLRAGLPVPPGFCLLTGAYAAAAEATELGPLVAQLAGLPPGDPRLASLAAAARERLEAAAIPAAIRAAVTAAYAALGPDQPVAVRSSATAEDLPFASFAGQQDSYLNVIGSWPLLEAVRRCWASLWTERAVAYRASNGIGQAAVRLAVVVQQMVEAEAAGVMFTANPLSGQRRQAVVDASPGLGEAVVSGAVNPDRFVLDRDSGAVVERWLGDKRLVVEPLAGGGTRRVPRDQPGAAEQACLSEAQLRALGGLAERVERLFGQPQDVEFAFDRAGRLWLTQARPITTLYPLPAPPGDGARIYFSFNVAQGVLRPLTPLGAQAIQLVAGGVARLLDRPPADRYRGPGAVVEAGQRLFLDLTEAVRSPLGRPLLWRFLAIAEARTALILRRLGDDPRFAPRRASPWPLARAAFALVRRTRLPLVVARCLLRPDSAARRVERVYRHFEALGAVRPEASAEAHLAAAERLLRGAPAALVAVAPVMLAALLAFLLAGRLLRGRASEDELQVVRRGLPYNPTTEMDLALWRIARRLADDEPSRAALLADEPAELARRYLAGQLPSLLQRQLAGFLAQYGHRGVAEIDLGLPRWSEDPTHLLGALANYLQLERPEAAPDAQFARAAREAEAAVERLAGRLGGPRGAVAGALLRRTRDLAGYREMPKFLLVLGFDRARRHLLSVGGALAEAGRLARPDDVFFLTLPEAWAGLAGQDLHATVAERRASYEQELRRRHVPRVLLSDGTEPEASLPPAAAAPDGTLFGTPASPGRVTAPARVVLDPTGARLEPGEILVAPSTDPGWTPLFLTAGGLVMEMGGSMSHGAVVAREYGLPAVVGVPQATERLQSGDLLALDGAAGTVRRLPPDAGRAPDPSPNLEPDASSAAQSTA